MKQLIKSLQKAHAGEWAAYYAYDGHMESLESPEDRIHLMVIRTEELNHILWTQKFLKTLGASPQPFRNLLFMTIGKVLSALCHVTGYRLPMLGARIMETVGVTNYREMALTAAEEGLQLMSVKLMHMAAQEKAHELWFQEKLNGNRRAS